MKNYKILLIGYSGKRNFGDDLLLAQSYSRLKTLNCALSIHTTEEDVTISGYLNNWFPDATIIRNKKITYSDLKGHTHIVYFGGGIFFEYNNYSRARFYKKILSILKQRVISKNLLGIKIFGVGIGLGPFVSKYGLQIVKKQLQLFDFLAVRDVESYNLATSLGIKNIEIFPDLSLVNIGKITKKDSADAPPGSLKILLCPRHYPHGENRNNYVSNLIEYFKSIDPNKFQLEVFAFQSGHDEDVMEEFRPYANSINVWNPDENTLEDVFKIFRDADVVVSSRMHGIFIAGIVNTPSISIGVHPKLKYASSFFENSSFLNELFTKDELGTKLSEFRNYDSNCSAFSKLSEDCEECYRQLLQKFN